MKKTMGLVSLMLLAYLATTAVAAREETIVTPLDTHRSIDESTFEADYETVWDLTVTMLTADQFKFVKQDKNSGQIETNFLILSRHPRLSNYSQGVRAFATVPRKFMRKWVDGRIRVHAQLKRLSERSTQVKLRPEIDGFATTLFDETGVSGTWHSCRSTGTFEFEFFNEMATKLRTHAKNLSQDQSGSTVQKPDGSPEEPPDEAASSLLLRSAPEGAEIYVDSRLIGMTPSRITLLPGDYKIIFRKSGYKDYQRNLLILENSQLTVLAELELQ